MFEDIAEFKRKATRFSKRWSKGANERAEAQTFWNEFFDVFGIDRREFAEFEKNVKKIDDTKGRIDLFWKGKLIAEHKSTGEDLFEAKRQLNEYFVGLKKADKPRYLIVSDFQKIGVHDTDTQEKFNISIGEFPDNLHKFSFIYSGYKSNWSDEEQVNIVATRLMGKLHDALKANGYKGEQLEILLMRILFCLFADDTGIFPKKIFQTYIKEFTDEDGSDLGIRLNALFEILNIPENKRQKNIPDLLQKFPFVNGSLYKDRYDSPSFSKNNRQILLECSNFNWNEISPVIFGSMFQEVMDEKKREHLGGHYTSEKNILKLVDALFLDELHKKLEQSKRDATKLKNLLKEVSEYKFLDPACGCGNFLIITYRELRLVEMKIFGYLQNLSSQNSHSQGLGSLIKLDSFYGIEHEEFPARVAETAMWLMEHKMNMEMMRRFERNIPTLPLKKSATIIHGNALRIDWNSIISRNSLSYILGNPPFIAKQERNREQQKDMDTIFNGADVYGNLDYVTAWYVKAADYISGTKIRVAYVSTNSIVQGEQVNILWKCLLKRGIKYHCAHRTFKWSNEANGIASVYVVIIGFGNFDIPDKYIFEYDTPKSLKPRKIKAKNINPYLIDFDDVVVTSRTKPLQEDTPEIYFGNQPNDNGHLLFTDEEKKEFIKEEPKAKPLIKPLISAREFLNGEKRWCLWLKDVPPKKYSGLKKIRERIELVKIHRLSSERPATKELAETPYLFGWISQPKTNFILIPLTSSENREYIPMAFFSPGFIPNNTCGVIPNATLYHFGILTSKMHMTWMRTVCGRMKSDYRYSNNLVYNNFPFPENISKIKQRGVLFWAKKVLNEREKYKESSLAELYNPSLMPEGLRKAHKELDRAVDYCYNSTFKDEISRLRFLFNMYKNKIETHPTLF